MTGGYLTIHFSISNASKGNGGAIWSDSSVVTMSHGSFTILRLIMKQEDSYLSGNNWI